MKYKIYDNQGKAIDRYTVVYKDGSYVGMSQSPFHPQGFCQHGEGLNYKQRNTHLGKRIKLSDLNEDCQQIIDMDLEFK